MTGTQTKNYS